MLRIAPHAARVRRAGLLLALALTGTTLAPAVASGQTANPRAGTDRATPVDDSATYAANEAAMGVADAIAQREGLDRDWVRQTIGQARRNAAVQRLMQPAASSTAKNWQLYRSRLVEPVRIRAGVQFWQAQQEPLARAEKLYGVPAEIIVGILGIETLYGQHMGRFRVLDALATLSFDFPADHPRAAQRQAFFRDELEQFLLLARREGVDPLTMPGSFAGAMGMPQFMPSSWLKYAVDFDGDGRIDLAGSPADAIGSVAHYFQAYGWRPGLPTHYAVRFDAARLDMKALLAPDILPTFSVAQFNAAGALLDDPGQKHPGLLALIELQNGDAPPSYLAGTENFYAITRYNWSSYYAMAVIELGRAVAAERARTVQTPRAAPVRPAPPASLNPASAAGIPG